MSRIGIIAACLLVGGCVVAPPIAPSVVAVPGSGKSMSTFQQDDASCQQYAAQQAGYAAPAEAANQSALSSMALGTGLGAAVGALFGAAAGNAGIGAAIGAGSGLLLGSVVGAGNAQVSASTVQQRYDAGYAQCMYSRGNKLSNEMPITQGGGYNPNGYYSNRYYSNQSYLYPAYPSYYYYYYPPYPGY